jgi:hypothetical protein
MALARVGRNRAPSIAATTHLIGATYLSCNQTTALCVLVLLT